MGVFVIVAAVDIAAATDSIIVYPAASVDTVGDAAAITAATAALNPTSEVIRIADSGYSSTLAGRENEWNYQAPNAPIISPSIKESSKLSLDKNCRFLFFLLHRRRSCYH